MKKKRNLFLSLVLVFTFVLPFALSACAKSKTNTNSNNATSATKEAEEELSQQAEEFQNVLEEVEVSTEQTTTDGAFTTLTELGSYNSKKLEYSKTIEEEGSYKLTGVHTGSLVIKKESGTVHLYLENCTITTPTSETAAEQNVPCIQANKGVNLIITLIGQNTLNNGSAEDENCIAVKGGNLTINGEGSLSITSSKSCIKVKADDEGDGGEFFGLGATLTLVAAAHGVSADKIYIDGSTINITSCGKDGIHAETDAYEDLAEDATAPTFSNQTGYFYMKSGTITATNCGGDGIQADSVCYISGGTISVTSATMSDSQFVVYSANLVSSGEYETSDFVWRKNGTNNYSKVAKDSAGSGKYALVQSMKGIKVGEIDYNYEGESDQTVSSTGYLISIQNGTLTFNTIDDAVHTNSGNVEIAGGTITVSTKDDGIHADNKLLLSGGTITISTSYEGLEAYSINISGGTTTITALDDGVNASGTGSPSINISGGRLDVTVSPSGETDGIDSNGTITITGGVVITRGPNSATACPLDADKTITLSGGIIIVIGYAPGSTGGRMSALFAVPGGGHGGMNFPGDMGGGSISTTLTKTTSSSGLSQGSHTVKVGSTTVSYINNYTYSGSTTVYASGTATVN